MYEMLWIGWSGVKTKVNGSTHCRYIIKIKTHKFSNTMWVIIFSYSDDFPIDIFQKLRKNILILFLFKTSIK